MSFGGSQWLAITKTLLHIQIQLEKAEQKRKEGDHEAYYTELMEMTSHINVLDGLTHNTGGLMDKLLDLEHEKQYPDYYRDRSVEDSDETERMMEDKRKSFEAFRRLMDSKELENHEDVLQEIMPILEKTDAPLTMKDWIGRARRINYTGDVEKREKELRAISRKKEMLGELSYAAHTKREIDKLALKADNQILRWFSDHLKELQEFSITLHNIGERLTWSKAQDIKEKLLIPIENHPSNKELLQSVIAEDDDGNVDYGSINLLRERLNFYSDSYDFLKNKIETV
jgi:hypothetical protein